MTLATDRIRWIQRALVVIGTASLGWAGFVWAERAWYRAYERQAVTESPTVHAPAPIAPVDAPVVSDAEDRRQFAGLLEIPRIGMSEAFAEGDDDSTLRKAIGHLPDTPLPWSQGNAAFAGHRDQHFRPLKNIRRGDDLRLVTPRGTLLYRVRDLFIVEPSEVWVLAPTNGRELTLITCYPFSYIGHAPKRFVVKAEPADDALQQLAFKR